MYKGTDWVDGAQTRGQIAPVWQAFIMRGLTILVLLISALGSSMVRADLLDITDQFVPDATSPFCFDKGGLNQDATLDFLDLPPGSTLNSLRYQIEVELGPDATVDEIELEFRTPGTDFTINSFSSTSLDVTEPISGDALGDYELRWDDAEDQGAGATGCPADFDNRIASLTITIDYTPPVPIEIDAVITKLNDADGDASFNNVEKMPPHTPTDVDFTVEIFNDSGQDIDIISLIDDIHGNLASTSANISSTTCGTLVGIQVQDGDTESCEFTASVTLGNGDSEENTIELLAQFDGDTYARSDGTSLILSDDFDQFAEALQTFYLPYPEDELFAAYNQMIDVGVTGNICTNSDVDPTMTTLVGVSILQDRTVIMVDHWEDNPGADGTLGAVVTGTYEPDVFVKTHGDTEIWGDLDISNGAPPGAITDADDLLNRGDTVLIDNDIPNADQNLPVPRSPVLYDGRDKIVSNKIISITRVGWADDAGTLLAGSFVAYDTSEWGRRFVLPVGEDIPVTAGLGGTEFEFVGASIMASRDGTEVEIDTNGDGIIEQVEFLDEGDSVHVNGGLQTGGTINANNPVQVHLTTGQYCSRFQGRSYALFPRDDWSETYFSPVDSGPNDPTRIWLYNPNEDPITISVFGVNGVEDVVGGDVVLAAGAVGFYDMPTGTAGNAATDSGARFTSDGDEPFYALATYDNDTGFDWGTTLVPGGVLSQQVLVGLGLGQDPDATLTENGNPIWITTALLDNSAPSNGVDICIDYGGDGDEGLGTGGTYVFNAGTAFENSLEFDLRVNLNELQRYKIYDPTGDDLTDRNAQSGMFVFVCDDDLLDAEKAVIAAAWGQDENTASSSTPGLDAGTVIPRVKGFIVSKRSAISLDLAVDGEANIGDEITYTINVINTGFVPLQNITMSDALPTELAYVQGSTTFFDADTFNPPALIPDDGTGLTAYPLDEGGVNLNGLNGSNLSVGETVTFTYVTRVIATPFQTLELCNTANGSTGVLNDQSEDCLPQAIIEPAGSIRGTVWYDVDGDGVLDIGEPGIGNVTVYLCGYIDEAGPPVVQQTMCNAAVAVQTTITDVNGDYDFRKLGAGSYQTAVEPTEKLAGNELEELSESPGNLAGLSGEIVLPLGGLEEADFGYLPQTVNSVETAVVEGTVYADLDRDGIQDPGEVGIAGVTVYLEDGSCTPAVDCASAVSAADGSYSFRNISFDADNDGISDGPQEFSVLVEVSDPELTAFCSGLTVVDYTGTDCSTNDPVINSVQSNPFTVYPGDIVGDVDFGFDPNGAGSLAIYTDRVWYDNNADRTQDPGEVGIEGIFINLLDENGFVVATTKTDVNGDFSFSGLDGSGTADYNVVIADQGGTLSRLFESTRTAGDQLLINITGDIDNTNPGDNGDQALITGSGTGSPSFGFVLEQSILGTVYSDGNASNDLEESDAGLGGITVQLQEPDGTVVATTLTLPDGRYFFTKLDAGSYVVVVDPDGGGNGTAPVGSQNADPADVDGIDHEESVTLFDGQSVTGVDFGYVETTLPDISGTVFLDVDTDGTYEPNGNDRTPGNSDDESGVAGVTIELLDNNGDVVAVTVTDANGNYIFVDVPEVDTDTNTTDYVVAVTDAEQILDGYNLTSGLDQIPVDSSGGDVSGIDFGYANDEATAAIASGVWIDSNGDGVRDPDETPVAAVTVNLYQDMDGDGVVEPNGDDGGPVATAETDAAGNLLFADLAPGTYLLDVDETDPQLSADFVEISNYSADFNDPNATILLSEGEQYKADFGFASDPAEAAISGILWADTGPDGDEVGDGILDDSELRLGGITVTLVRDTNGDGFFTDAGAAVTTTTAADGSYVFSGLSPCPSEVPCFLITYDRPEVNALGLNGEAPTNTPDQNTGNPTNPTPGPDGINDPTYLVTVLAGETGEDFNFGFDVDPGGQGSFGEIEGYVYFEPATGMPNGTFDGSDVGIEEVTLNLLDSGGNVVATTVVGDGTTDANGDGLVNSADLGYYHFSGLLAGDYTVAVTDTSNALINFNPSGDPDETPGLCSVCDEQSGITVGAGLISGVNFGYIGEQLLGNIGSLVWFDAVNDGMFNPEDGDVGIEGVTVECWVDTNGDGDFGVAGANDFAFDGIDNLVRTVRTDSNGEYYCEGLPTGAYFVRVTDDDGVIDPALQGAMVLGGTGEPTDADETNKVDITTPHAWYIETGSDNLTADFAVTGSADLSISGRVFEEEASLIPPDNTDSGDPAVIEVGEVDGSYDDDLSDAPATGVTVLLLLEDGAGVFQPFLTTTTDADGLYSFNNLPMGTFQVVVDTTGSGIEGFGQTRDQDLPNNNVGIGGDAEAVCDSGTAALCDDVVEVELTFTAVSGVDFGYQDGFTTTPATVSYFTARSVGDGVEFRWNTSNEVGNLGFQLYARTAAGWVLLNEELIRHSDGGDSLQKRSYRHTVARVDAKWFALIDVSVNEELTPHGPYRRDQEYGAVLVEAEPYDWSQVDLRAPARSVIADSVQQRLRRAQLLDDQFEEEPADESEGSEGDEQ